MSVLKICACILSLVGAVLFVNSQTLDFGVILIIEGGVLFTLTGNAASQS